MQVKDVMTQELITVSTQDTAAAAARLLSRNNIGAVPVCNQDGKLKGMLTDRDIVLRCIAADRDPNTTTVDKIMTEQVVSVSPEDQAATAADQMARARVRRLPVAEHGRGVGMVSLGDLAVRPDYSTEASACLSEICSNILRR